MVLSRTTTSLLLVVVGVVAVATFTLSTVVASSPYSGPNNSTPDDVDAAVDLSLAGTETKPHAPTRGLASTLLALIGPVLGAISVATSAVYYTALAAAALVLTFAVSAAVGLFYSADEAAKKEWRTVARDVYQYYACLGYFLFRGGTLKACPYFVGEGSYERQARLQLFSLALVFTLWDRPHYRNGTFQDDMKKNLRNVAIPGTGVPLSLLCYSKLQGYAFLAVGYPVVALVAALHRGGRSYEKVGAAFREQLLTPQDWFSFWRLNCRLATYHSSVMGSNEAVAASYSLEDKWKFLLSAEKHGVPVTPHLKIPGLVAKHRNEEGGMGFCSFDNAAAGGDWIIQTKLSNDPFLRSLLPKNPPLSTFRVITQSNAAYSTTDGTVTPLSCVFRAGRANAKTDHVSILFDVDVSTGVVGKGTTSAHWYQLGADKILTTPWTSTHDTTHHPDGAIPVEGAKVPDFAAALELVRDAHAKLCPHVPLVGWDVALTEEHGMLLLEGNFSCNFFRGTFDQNLYFRYVENLFLKMEELDGNGNNNNNKTHAATAAAGGGGGGGSAGKKVR